MREATAGARQGGGLSLGLFLRGLEVGSVLFNAKGGGRVGGGIALGRCAGRGRTLTGCSLGERRKTLRTRGEGEMQGARRGRREGIAAKEEGGATTASKRYGEVQRSPTYGRRAAPNSGGRDLHAGQGVWSLLRKGSRARKKKIGKAGGSSRDAVARATTTHWRRQRCDGCGEVRGPALQAAAEASASAAAQPSRPIQTLAQRQHT